MSLISAGSISLDSTVATTSRLLATSAVQNSPPFLAALYNCLFFNSKKRLKKPGPRAVNTDIHSVADPGCLSRITDSDFYPSRIRDPGSKNSNKERGENNSCHTFLCRHIFHKIVNYFGFEVLKKKIWANFQRIIELFTTKLSKSS